MNLCKWFFWGIETRRRSHSASQILSAVCHHSSSQGQPFMAWPAGRHRQGTKALHQVLLQRTQSSRRQKEEVAHLCIAVNLSAETGITRKALGKGKSQWFQKTGFHGAPYSAFEASCLRLFHGCSSAQRKLLRKISAEIAVFVRLLAAKVL